MRNKQFVRKVWPHYETFQRHQRPIQTFLVLVSTIPAHFNSQLIHKQVVLEVHGLMYAAVTLSQEFRTIIVGK